jgi:microcystin-dependent protein
VPIQTSDPVTVFRELLNAMIGCIFATGRSTAPAGFLLCDGAAVLRADYADLFTAVGTAYGAGNGTTTFNVPDLRGRAPVGVDGTAGRLTANDARGNAGGAQDRTLTIPTGRATRDRWGSASPPASDGSRRRLIAAGRSGWRARRGSWIARTRTGMASASTAGMGTRSMRPVPALRQA